jgi:hypothetical protein
LAAAVHGTKLDLNQVEDPSTTIKQSHFSTDFSWIGGDIAPGSVSARSVAQYDFSTCYKEIGRREQDVVSVSPRLAPTDPRNDPLVFAHLRGSTAPQTQIALKNFLGGRIASRKQTRSIQHRERRVVAQFSTPGYEGGKPENLDPEAVAGFRYFTLVGALYTPTELLLRGSGTGLGVSAFKTNLSSRDCW